MKDDVPVLLAEGIEGRVQIKAVVLGHRGQQMEVVDVSPIPALNSALAEGEAAIGDHPLGVNELPYAQAVTARARPGGVVKGKQPGLEFA